MCTRLAHATETPASSICKPYCTACIYRFINIPHAARKQHGQLCRHMTARFASTLPFQGGRPSSRSSPASSPGGKAPAPEQEERRNRALAFLEVPGALAGLLRLCLDPSAGDKDDVLVGASVPMGVLPFGFRKHSLTPSIIIIEHR